MGNKYAVVMWVAEDVQWIRPGWPIDKCERELAKVADRLEEVLVKHGSEALDVLLPSD